MSRRNNDMMASGHSIWISAWLLLCVLLNPSPHYAAGPETILLSFLDVGQGDATLIHAPESCTALIDTGPLINGHRVTRILEDMQIESLDLVIITHPHLDHFGGLFDIAPRVPIKKFYDNGQDNKVWEYFDDYRALRAQLNHTVLRRGDILKCGTVRFEVLYPEETTGSVDNPNENSLALLIRVGSTRILHMGDLAGDGANRLLQLHDEIDADLLKVAHHGARDASSAELLNRASPTYAVISTSDTNRIDSPADETLERLNAVGATVLRTDRDGTVKFIINGAGLRLLSP